MEQRIKCRDAVRKLLTGEELVYHGLETGSNGGNESRHVLQRPGLVLHQLLNGLCALALVDTHGQALREHVPRLGVILRPLDNLFGREERETGFL